ncbi:MAG: DUF6364 family protein [Thermoleophilia bacterium]
MHGILYGMDETKMTVRVSKQTLEDAKSYAREHGTTLTRLVVTHLEHLRREADLLRDAPVTRRLAGVLPPEASRQEHQDYLERKYG